MASDILKEPLKAQSDEVLDAHVHFFLMLQYVRDQSHSLEQRNTFIEAAHYQYEHLCGLIRRCYIESHAILEADMTQQGER